MAPQLKLTYFNITGLGEPIRYILHYGKIQFEDNRIEIKDFDKLKPNTPFGKLPYLEEDGKLLTQSSVICRYVAKKAGLLGKSEWDAIQADEVADTIKDLLYTYTNYFTEKDEDKKAIHLEEVKTHNNFYLTRFEKIVQENGGYFVNGQLTWADLLFAAFMEMLITINKEPLLNNYPSLKSLQEKVENLPGIKEYRAKRPQTAY